MICFLKTIFRFFSLCHSFFHDCSFRFNSLSALWLGGEGLRGAWFTYNLHTEENDFHQFTQYRAGRSELLTDVMLVWQNSAGMCRLAGVDKSNVLLINISEYMWFIYCDRFCYMLYYINYFRPCCFILYPYYIWYSAIWLYHTIYYSIYCLTTLYTVLYFFINNR